MFFLPLPMHKDAENKVKYIFCANDTSKAYEEAMQGKLDGTRNTKSVKNRKSMNSLKHTKMHQKRWA